MAFQHKRLWGVHMPDQPPISVKIKKIENETPNVSTIFFDHDFPSIPGQFVMVWIPGVDEIPMALSYSDAITVQRVGDATSNLLSLKIGDKIGIRGPFGNGFRIYGKTLVVAGGVGIAPLIRVGLCGSNVDVLLGSKTKEELVFSSDLKNSSNLMVSTDDGSEGYHGFIPGLMEQLPLESYDSMLVCGPELMMFSVLSVLKNRNLVSISQFSLHRYMKCGVGLCGSCCLDPEGLCVCKDGPVFSGLDMLKSEMGKYHRNAAGLRQI
jgi:dihydroorotate dehydrogenase electron transfer subunit